MQELLLSLCSFGFRGFCGFPEVQAGLEWFHEDLVRVYRLYLGSRLHPKAETFNPWRGMKLQFYTWPLRPLTRVVRVGKKPDVRMDSPSLG